jgi:ABC-type antimicrobial peptide transport system permease subunit
MLINHLRTALRGLTRAKTHALINIGKKFATEERIGKVAGVFAALAILISCLGLFGMALFIAEQRTREIGIRKVLGARVVTLWGLLSKEFVSLVLLSIAIAVPVAWYFMQGWLQNYPFHIGISWANPVDALRNE